MGRGSLTEPRYAAFGVVIHNFVGLLCALLHFHKADNHTTATGKTGKWPIIKSLQRKDQSLARHARSWLHISRNDYWDEKFHRYPTPTVCAFLGTSQTLMCQPSKGNLPQMSFHSNFCDRICFGCSSFLFVIHLSVRHPQSMIPFYTILCQTFFFNWKPIFAKRLKNMFSLRKLNWRVAGTSFADAKMQQLIIMMKCQHGARIS